MVSSALKTIDVPNSTPIGCCEITEGPASSWSLEDNRCWFEINKYGENKLT